MGRWGLRRRARRRLSRRCRNWRSGLWTWVLSDYCLCLDDYDDDDDDFVSASFSVWSWAR